MSPKSTIRRLFKSRLRLHVFRALATQQAEESWAALIEVEEGIEEDAWLAWRMFRANQADREIGNETRVALREAAVSVRDTFAEAADLTWLDQRIQDFLDRFTFQQLTEGHTT